MKLRLTICALVITSMGTVASASSEDGWTGWGDWEGTNWGWNQEKTWDGGFCPDDEQCDTGDCDPPTAVPSPTAAIAGLGVMGLMLSRRRNRRAQD